MACAGKQAGAGGASRARSAPSASCCWRSTDATASRSAGLASALPFPFCLLGDERCVAGIGCGTAAVEPSPSPTERRSPFFALPFGQACAALSVASTTSAASASAAPFFLAFFFAAFESSAFDSSPVGCVSGWA